MADRLPPAPVPTQVAPRSALDGVASSGRHGDASGPAGVHVQLRAPLSLALLLPAPGQASACLQRLEQAFGTPVSTLGPRRAAMGPDLELLWSGPDRYLAGIAEDTDLEARLQAACGPTAAVIDQSDGRFALRLSGPAVRRTLAKGLTLDLHPRAFAVGETALTMLAHLNVQLTRVGTDSTFDLIASRASAGNVWHWLEASAGEFGLQADLG